MLVNKLNFDSAISKIAKAANEDKALGFDTETTILPHWRNPFYFAAGLYPRVFSMQFATKTEEFYFDFNELGDKHFAIINREITTNPDTLNFIANAKFDLHHSRNHDVEFAGPVHCTKSHARIVNNTEPSISLDSLGEKYLGAGKIDFISKIKAAGHVTQLKKYGHNDKYEEVLHFDRMPIDELVLYGCKDTRLCFDLGVWQWKEINRLKDKSPKIMDVWNNELKLTKVLFEMEREGVMIDRAYTEEAYENEVSEYRKLEASLNTLAGAAVDWNSAKQLKPIFERLGEPYVYTEKGNASFDSDALEESSSQLAKEILKYRYHYKRAHTYFENFIWLADDKNIIHADTQPAGTQFGRMSYWNPNLQNVPKRKDKGEAKYKVRRCFIPKPGKILVDIDYTGAEFYMSMDYSKELGVIEELKTGLDPHERLSGEMQINDRDKAKTMQFRILYGGGGMAVGKALGYKGAEADRIGKVKKREYFERMPELAAYMRKVSSVAGGRGFIFNWLGRLLCYDRNTSYKSFNGLIQSGVGDMTKIAMTRIADANLPVKMLIQVHDALLLEAFPHELVHVPAIQQIMCNAYPHKLLPMKTDVGYSDKSWSDLQDSPPGVA